VQTFNDVMVQKSIMLKGLIKCSNINGMTPMTIHVQTTHRKLFALKKQLFNEVVEHVVIHAQQSRKKGQVLAMPLLHFLRPQTFFKS